MDPAVSGAACGAVSRPEAQPWRVVRRGSRQNLVQPPMASRVFLAPSVPERTAESVIQ